MNLCHHQRPTATEASSRCVMSHTCRTVRFSAFENGSAPRFAEYSNLFRAASRARRSSAMAQYFTRHQRGCSALCLFEPKWCGIRRCFISRFSPATYHVARQLRSIVFGLHVFVLRTAATATLCNTLQQRQHFCNRLQHFASFFNTLQQFATL